MIPALILFLTISSLLLAKLWHSSKAENVELRTHIATLKRQIAKQRNSPAYSA